MTSKWRAPKKTNDRAWKMIEAGDTWWDKKAVAKSEPHKNPWTKEWRERAVWLARLRNKKYALGLTGRP